jgi:hypothetical protein
MRKLRDEVRQMFVDAASWNENARKPDEAPIDPDPYGDLKRLLDELNRALEHDKGHGPIERINFKRSH